MIPARTALALGLAIASPAVASPAVVADVAAVHSIVANVMEGVGQPTLLLPPGASPHEYALRPSEAAALEAAEIVFWVGEAYTPWLAEPIATLAPDARRVALQDAPGLQLLPVREGGPFEQAPHHGNADAHSEADSDEHSHGHSDRPHDDHHASDAAIDGHLWLDPRNAAAMAEAAAASLAEADPGNSARYRANADAFAREMEALIADVERRLAPAGGRDFVVFHDAYQYFENRFGLPASGSIAVHDADQPSPARMAEIRARIRDAGVACVFAEPQFPTSLAETAIEGTSARLGTLDPIGADLEPGASFYPALIRGLAEDLLACLAE